MNTSFGSKLRLTLASILAIAVGVFVFSYTIDVFLMLFAGILGALFLNALGSYVHDYTGFGPRLSVATVIICLLLVVLGTSALFANSLLNQLSELSTSLPQALSDLQTSFSNVGWLQSTLDSLRNVDWRNVLVGEGTVVSRVSTVASVTGAAIAGALITLFVAVYLALEPGRYRHGVIRLVPERQVDVAENLLDRLASILRWWLVGKAGSMLVVAGLTALGLWAIGMPLVGVLALIAGLFSFVPNFGPIVSAIPAVLVGFSISPEMAIWVIGLYLAVQFVESYIITPVIQQRTVSLPPAVLLLSQLLFGLLFGFLGILLAAPLSAGMAVVIDELYVKQK